MRVVVVDPSKVFVSQLAEFLVIDSAGASHHHSVALVMVVDVLYQVGPSGKAKRKIRKAFAVCWQQSRNMSPLFLRCSPSILAEWPNKVLTIHDIALGRQFLSVRKLSALSR